MNQISIQDLVLPSESDRLPRLQEDSSESNVQETISKVDVAISSVIGGQRAVFNEIIGDIIPGVSSDNLQGAASSTAPRPPPPTTASSSKARLEELVRCICSRRYMTSYNFENKTGLQ